MYKVPENELTLEAVKKAIFNIAECLYFTTDSKDMDVKFQKMCMVDFAEYFINEYAEDVYLVAKKEMFPIKNFRYAGSNYEHLVMGEPLFDRPAFNLMLVEKGHTSVHVAPTSTITDEPEIFEDTSLYMLDNGEVYLVDSMMVNLGNNTDVKYSRIRSYLYAQYTEFSIESFEQWLRIIKHRREKMADGK